MFYLYVIFYFLDLLQHYYPKFRKTWKSCRVSNNQMGQDLKRKSTTVREETTGSAIEADF